MLRLEKSVALGSKEMESSDGKEREELESS